MKEGFLYILQSEKNGRYYIGSTDDIARRLGEHNRGHTKSTANLVPWKLVFCQKYQSVVVARQMELRLKKFKNREIIKRIIIEQKIKAGL